MECIGRKLDTWHRVDTLAFAIVLDPGDLSVCFRGGHTPVLVVYAGQSAAIHIDDLVVQQQQSQYSYSGFISLHGQFRWRTGCFVSPGRNDVYFILVDNGFDCDCHMEATKICAPEIGHVDIRTTPGDGPYTFIPLDAQGNSLVAQKGEFSHE